MSENPNEIRFWVKTPWDKAQLEGKNVRFRLTGSGSRIEGTGKFRVTEPEKNRKRVQIVSTIGIGYELTEQVLTLTKHFVDSIRKVEGNAEVDFEILA